MSRRSNVWVFLFSNYFLWIVVLNLLFALVMSSWAFAIWDVAPLLFYVKTILVVFRATLIISIPPTVFGFWFFESPR
jgi:hypothetical protein